MAVYKRGQIWWYKFNWNGEPIRESTKQTNKRVAEQMEATHKTSLAKGEVGLRDRAPVLTLKDFMKADSSEGPEPTWTSKKLGKGSVAYADGQLYCYSESKGEVVLIKADPKDWIESGRFTIPEKSKYRPNNSGVWAHPVIANGKLYLREYEWLFCYDVTGKE